MHSRDGESAGAPVVGAATPPSASAIVDATPEAVLVIDGAGRIGTGNRAAERLFGYARGELEGRAVTELLPRANLGARGGADRPGHADAPRSATGHDLEGQSRDGRRLPLRASVAELDEQGHRWCVVVVQDVAAVRAAQAGREQSLRQLHCIQALATRMRLDPPLAELLAAIGETLPPALAPARAHVCVRVDEQEWRSPGWPATGTELNETIEAEGASRGALVVRVTGADGTPADEERETVRTVATMLGDMVARRHKARELQRYAQELESFSYSVSHDLRAPLRALDGFSRALAERYPGALDERGRDYLQRIRNASQRMSHLIDALLRLSRISRRSMAWAPLDLSALANEVVAELRAAEPERAVDFRCEPGLAVWGDDALLRIALQNLLGNAWKFTAATAGPVIELGRDPAQPGRFHVRDNGAGFDARYVDRLFGAFQRLHGEREFAGTGIGLVTVKRIVLRHGGAVGAEGAPGAGATFWFELPPAGSREVEEDDGHEADPAD